MMEDHKPSPILFPTSLNEGDSVDKDHFVSNMRADFRRMAGQEFKTVTISQREVARRIKTKVGKKDYDPPFWRDRRLLSKQDSSPERIVSAGRSRSENPRFEVEMPSPTSPTTQLCDDVSLSPVKALSLSRKVRTLSAVRGERTKAWH